GPADRTAELVIAQGGPGPAGAVGEEIVGRQRIVPEIFKEAAVQRVGSAFGDHIDDSAARIGILRAEIACLNLELLHLFNLWTVFRAVESEVGIVASI